MTGRPPDHDLLGEPEQAAPSEEDERGADIFPTEEPPPADRYSDDLPLAAPRTIRLPAHVVKELNVVLRALRHLENHAPASGRDATLEDVAHLLGKPVAEVERLLRYHEQPLSLDAPLDRDPGVTVGEGVADESALSPELLLHESALERTVAEWLGELSERQRRVVERRYGLNNCNLATLDELAREIGVTRERVRQI